MSYPANVLTDEWRAMADVADGHAKRKLEQEDRPEEALYHLGQAAALRSCAIALDYVEAMRRIGAKR